MADDEFDLKTMTRVQIIDWMRNAGYDGPVSYTKTDLIERIVPNWQNPQAEEPPAEGEESNVAPITKAKRSRKKAAEAEAEATPEGEGEASAVDAQ